jgi:hypothetical protein
VFIKKAAAAPGAAGASPLSPQLAALLANPAVRATLLAQLQ